MMSKDSSPKDMIRVMMMLMLLLLVVIMNDDNERVGDKGMVMVMR